MFAFFQIVNFHTSFEIFPIFYTDCERTFTKFPGDFFTPYYPYCHLNGHKCKLTIKARQGFRIKITVVDMDIQDCQHSAVNVLEENNDLRIRFVKINKKIVENSQFFL